MYYDKHFMFCCLFTGEVVITESDIFIENMPIITPNGDVIVKSLSLQVHGYQINGHIVRLKEFHQ